MKPIILCGEAMGANEVRIGAGFVGASGIELLKMLNESGIITLTSEDGSYLSRYWDTGDPNFVDMVWRMHPEVYRTNVFQLHPQGNDISSFCGTKAEGISGYPPLLKSKYILREYIPQLERLGDEIIKINPNLIIAFGNTPLWALCGIIGISKVRGSTRLSTHTVSGYKVLPTYHPAAVIRQWELRPTTITDLQKARHEADFAEVRRPKCQIWIEPTLTDIERFFDEYARPGTRFAVDIETSGNQVTCIGFGIDKGVAIVIPFFDSSRKNRSYWPDRASEHSAWRLVNSVLSRRNIKKTFQNGLYDIAFLWRSVGIKVLGAEHDTMLLHHALQPESLKNLGYLGSIYTDHGPWKTERKTTTIKRDE